MAFEIRSSPAQAGALLVATFVFFAAIFHQPVRVEIATINLSLIDVAGALGTLLLLKRQIVFPATVLVVCSFHRADEYNFQSMARDLMPLVYVGYIYYGTHLKTVHLLRLLLVTTIVMGCFSIIYLVETVQKWHRFYQLTEAEGLMVLGFCFYRQIYSHALTNSATRSVIGGLVTLSAIFILVAQVITGARAVALVLVIIAGYYLLKSRYQYKVLWMIPLVIVVIGIISARPLAYLRVLDLIQGTNYYHGSTTFNYRLANYQVLWEAILENPYIGNGFGQYFSFQVEENVWTTHPAWIVHNDLLAIVYYVGIVGVMVLMGYLTYKSMFLKPDPMLSGTARLVLCSLGILALTTPVMGNFQTAPIAWIALGCIYRARANDRSSADSGGQPAVANQEFQ